MATKRSSQPTKAEHSARATARSVWLAGLGAASIARKHGAQWVATWIEEGKVLQARTEQLAREVRADLMAQAKGAFAPIRLGLERQVGRIGEALQSGVSQVLHQLGIPSKADIVELTERVTALSRQLKAAK
jgi:poly(hydroxyalkanoate) granule-associated protein